MKTNPRISIIVPVYNVEKYVETCIDSIKSQSFNEFEAIIVDDGSKDSSIAICEKLISGDARFKILHKENGGLMSAWKYGLQRATGEYVGFVDSDDWIDPDMFFVLSKSIQEHDADIVISGYVTEDNKLRNRWTRDRQYIYEGESIKSDFLKDYCCSYFHSVSNPSICRWDKLYKRDILLQNIDYFNEKVSLAEDFNTNVPVILDARKIVLLPNFTPYHYRFNPKSIMNTINPRAFYNVKELGNACSKIIKEKGVNGLYIDSFIGNIIFEEINRICRSVSLSEVDGALLNENLELCNGFHYLNSYAKVRSVKRIDVYNWLIQHRLFKAVKLLTVLNNFRL